MKKKAAAILKSNDIALKKKQGETDYLPSEVPTKNPALDGRPVKSSVLVAGTKMKNSVLRNYSEMHGKGHPQPVVSTKKGENFYSIGHPPPSQHDLVNTPVMRPKKDMSYREGRGDEGWADFRHVVITIVINSLLDDRSVAALACANKPFSKAIPDVLRLKDVDYSPLLQPRYGYASQMKIDPDRVDMLTAAFVHCGLDPGRLIRLIRGEAIGAGRDWKRVLSVIRPVLSDEDYEHARRILMDGCPGKLNFLEQSSNKLAIMQRGNQKAFEENPETTYKTLNKEERNDHMFVLQEWVCYFSPYVRHTPQGLILKLGKNARMVWDGSTMRTAVDVVMNEVTSMEDEADITFGDVKTSFLTRIYNERISFPDDDIYMVGADVKACFRWPRFAPDVAGAFGFLAAGLYCLPTAMVFGSNTSATSWEPFRRAIEGLTVVMANRKDLLVKHKDLLDMVSWQKFGKTPLVQAHVCPLNPGILDSEGNEIVAPTRFYVDDALLATRGRQAIMLRMAVVIEAIFQVMGEPNVALRQCPLAMDKWEEACVGIDQLVLGLDVSTRRLVVGIPEAYRAEVYRLLETTWPNNKRCQRKRFLVSEANKLVGKLARLAEGAPWVFHLMSHLYMSLAHALCQNKELLKEFSTRYRDLLEKAANATSYSWKERNEQAKGIRFALKQAAKMAHSADYEYNINKTMRAELDFFRDKLRPDSGLTWETPIAFVIRRTPTATSYGDSCLDGGGGYSIGLKFWWHLEFPSKVVRRTLRHKTDNSDGQLISINVLEFVTVIINYCAALTVFELEKVTSDPHPILLNACDNISAMNWTIHKCKSSKTGRLLARFFCCLLIESDVGINSTWISTHENFVADDISRLRREAKANSTNHFSFSYQQLKQKYSELQACRFFQPSPELESMIWDLVLTEKWPSLEQTRALKRRGLGKLTT